VVFLIASVSNAGFVKFSTVNTKKEVKMKGKGIVHVQDRYHWMSCYSLARARCEVAVDDDRSPRVQSNISTSVQDEVC
jgi:hypothetical protein